MDCNAGTTLPADCSTPAQCKGKDGAAVCDPRYADLPTATAIKLVGVNGECLYNFPEGSRGIVYFDGADNKARVSEAPCLDLPRLIEYLKDANVQDGLARKNGKLVEGAPPNFNHILVLKDDCDICEGTAPCWYKWRGQEDLPGYIYWTGANFVFGQINEDGVETTAILEPYTTGYLPIYPETVNPAVNERKVQGYWRPPSCDIAYVDNVDGVARPVNTAEKQGFLVYAPRSISDARICPQVKTLLESALPSGVSPAPAPVRIIGVDSGGNSAAMVASPVLPAKACGLLPLSPGSGGEIVWASVGRSLFPATGTLRTALVGATGSSSSTITYAAIQAAVGAFPHIPTHYLIWAEATLTASVADRKTLSIEVGGRIVLKTTAYSWAPPVVDEDVAVSCVLVPASSNGDLSFNLTHSSIVGSTYGYTVDVVGAFLCSEEVI